MKTKVCSKCGRRKAAALFSPRPERASGLYSCCKKCKSESKATRYSERRATDPVPLWIVNTLNRSRDRSRTQGLAHTITHGDVTAALERCGLVCVYCDVELNFRRGHKDRFDGPALDRLEPGRGYIPENIVVCCYRCNAIKNNATAQELRQIADRLTSLLSSR